MLSEVPSTAMHSASSHLYPRVKPNSLVFTKQSRPHRHCPVGPTISNMRQPPTPSSAHPGACAMTKAHQIKNKKEYKLRPTVPIISPSGPPLSRVRVGPIESAQAKPSRTGKSILNCTVFADSRLTRAQGN